MNRAREEPPHGPGPARPSLRENALGVPRLTTAMAVRAQAYLFASAGVVGALAVILPHPQRFNEVGMLCVQMGSLGASIVVLLMRDRMPGPLVAAGPYGAAVLTSVVLLFSGASTSAYLLFYLWVAFYAFYFLTRRAAVALSLFTVVNYALVVVAFRLAGGAPSGPHTHEDVPALVLTVGTVMVAGVFIVLLRERVGRLIRQLTDAASTDPLTGLLNRRGFHSVIENEMDRAARTGGAFSVLLGDCDFFKQVNDSLGHHAGDQALLTIGRMLDADKRRIDIAARIGGEEFALVLPDTDEHEAYLVAERIRTRFAEIFARQPVPLTMSFGVATYPVHGESDDDLLRAADEALYAAKALGRDRTVRHSVEIEGILATRGAHERTRGEAHLATVLNLAEALDMRDTGTARHSQTVGRYCEIMGRELGLSQEEIERVRLAGVLHDIGKIGVPDSVLAKPGPLDADEFELMRKHPEIGSRILGGSGLNDIRRWVLCHHERPDGGGYPRGLAGPEIPLEAKILAVGDAYEAMTSDRVYRPAIGAEAAKRELRAGAGTQFDPIVVDAFLKALGREGQSQLELARPATARG